MRVVLVLSPFPFAAFEGHQCRYGIIREMLGCVKESCRLISEAIFSVSLRVWRCWNWEQIEDFRLREESGSGEFADGESGASNDEVLGCA